MEAQMFLANFKKGLVKERLHGHTFVLPANLVQVLSSEELSKRLREPTTDPRQLPELSLATEQHLMVRKMKKLRSFAALHREERRKITNICALPLLLFFG